MLEDFEKNVDEIAKRWIDDIKTVKPSVVPDTLFHYTDSAGLIGMLSSHKIWLTDMRFLNDKTELVHTKNLVKTVFEQFRLKASSTVSDRLIERIEHWQQEDSADEVFSFSLSAKGDDLSQWRGYAKEGHGFTVGFSGPKMMEAQKKTNSFSFAQVHYEQKKQIKALLLALKEIDLATIKQCELDEAEADEYIDAAAAAYDWVIDSRAALNKHHSFLQEDEWRIFGYVNHATDDEGAADSESVKVRSSGLKIIPYVEESMSEEADSKLPIDSIGIGPAFAGGEEIHAIKALCRLNGYSPKIYFADTPYRGA